jgi:hypothetical protein
MTQDFKQHYIATVGAALVAALPTRASTKPAPSRGMTPKEVAASFNMEYDEDDGPIDTVKNKNHTLFKVTATNMVPAHLAGDNHGN